jgi:CheY-like chemotaxis protein
MLDAIFDMFTQVDRSLERTQAGLGVGLTLAKRIIELHGGTITAESEGQGYGSRFTVRLPVARAPLDAARPAPATHEVQQASGLRILIADDNQDFAGSIAMLLANAGHEVRVAHDGLAALDAAIGLEPHVAFLDIGLPGRNGYDLARALRAHPDTAHMLLVAVTGWGQEKDRRLAREAGFDRHLVKPVEPAAVFEILSAVHAARKEGSMNGAPGSGSPEPTM